MQIRERGMFTTIHTEGSILPADLLQRIDHGDRGLGGLTPEAYHLDGNERLNEVINRSWNRLLGAWASFRSAKEKLSEGDLGTVVTRERWLLPLFQELDYGRLLGAKTVEIEGRSFPISHSWHRSPIHLVGVRVDLDRRTPGVAGAARLSPHGLVQELLNKSAEHLWGFVSNGLRLRILRENIRLTRQAYVEFDLEAMLDGEVYADFVLLWLLCHQSRVEADKPEDCWLEKWSRAAQEQGTRFLEQLRDGVEAAITALARGFLSHPANQTLRDNLRSGALNTQDYYREVLRLVYRLLFLFVAEDRDLLLDPEADEVAKERYKRFYSTSRLRRLAERRRGSRHADLYQGLRLVIGKLGSKTGCPELGLPALGSFLYSKEAAPDLEGCEIANHDFLDTLRSLAFTIDGHTRRRVDYRNLGAEELGSVYESLLELHPQLNPNAGTFELKVAGGNERKTTGSYYTPDSLVQCLLDSALDPVLDEAARKADPEAAILRLKVCDPACGSGHFLIAAAHRIARRLASARTGEDEPSPKEVRRALRDVVGHCIYGVDINPMAVELCKVNLWLEALEPGKPLSFLDHRIQCGNSLIGTTPALLKKGIPDEAFTPIEGDDKAICSEFKKRNKKEREGHRSFWDAQLQPWQHLGDLATSMMSVDDLADDTIDDVQRKQERYESLVRSAGYLYGRFLADTWCAAFVWKKSKEFPYPITEQVFRKVEQNPYDIAPWMRDEIQRLAGQYQFFHWHIAFPDVFRVPAKDEEPESEQAGWCGGFDVMLGNPPWERLQFEERTFFESKDPSIYAESRQSRRRKMIANLRTTDPTLYDAWADASRRTEHEAEYLRDSGQFPLSAVDKFNLYAVFSELTLNLYRKGGRCGIIVKGGLVTDDLCSSLFSHVLKTRKLVSVVEFENKLKLFPSVHPQERFALVTFGNNTSYADLSFDNWSVTQSRESYRHLRLSYDDVALLSPNTKNCPKFSNVDQLECTMKCHKRFPAFIQFDPPRNDWGASIDRYINVSDVSDEIVLANEFNDIPPGYFHPSLDTVPLYEGKLIHQFDHRYATYSRKGNDSQTVEIGAKLPETTISFFRFISRETALRRNPELGQVSALLAARDITNRTNERGVIASIIPPNITDYTIRVIRVGGHSIHKLILVSMLNSFVLDFLARQRIGGTHLSNSVIEQTPIPPPYLLPQSFVDFVVPRAIELTYTAWDLKKFAEECGFAEPPFYWNEQRRFLLRCELDAAYFHLYGVERNDVDYIMETFPIVKRKDEQHYGEYRTKRVILEIYDAMQRAMETGEPYQTLLDPPPADPRVAHPARNPDGGNQSQTGDLRRRPAGG